MLCTFLEIWICRPLFRNKTIYCAHTGQEQLEHIKYAAHKNQDRDPATMLSTLWGCALVKTTPGWKGLEVYNNFTKHWTTARFITFRGPLKHFHCRFCNLQRVSVFACVVTFWSVCVVKLMKLFSEFARVLELSGHRSSSSCVLKHHGASDQHPHRKHHWSKSQNLISTCDNCKLNQ